MKAILSVLALLLLLPTNVAAQGIDKAYQKEFAYLQAQKSALQSRLNDLERSGEKAGAVARAELSALQSRLVELQLRGDTLQEQLTETERDALRTDERSENLAAVFEQARASLERYDVDVTIPDETPNAADLRALFAAAMPVLEASGEVRKEPGSFFLADGRKVEGEITHVGRIAAFGATQSGTMPLAPAGEARFKAWEAEKPGGLFLFEATDKAVEQTKEGGWLETIEAGGVIAWVITGLGLLALLLIFWRIVALLRAGSTTRAIDQVCRLVAVGRYAEARRLLADARGATARVLSRTVEVIEERRKVADDAIVQAILEEQPAIDRFGTAIMVFAAVAPLLGLLGTVTGMIATFDVITTHGTGDPKMLSGGISEALITTQLGLMVAIPALLVGNLLNARAASLIDGFEHAALRVLNAARTEPPHEPTDAEPRLIPDVATLEPTT